jgi:hypothetical protein
MTLFPDLRAELVGAMERGPHRRRPQAALVLVPLLVALAFVVWPRDVEVTVSPPAVPGIADLPRPIRTAMTGAVKIKPGSPLSVVRQTDSGGLTWTAVAFVSQPAGIGYTAAPAGLDGLPGSWSNGAFPLASGLLRSGSITQAGVALARHQGRTHVLVFGTVDARAKAITVELAGERQIATLSPVTLTLAIPKSMPGLTAEGRRERAAMPDTVTVRAFAATFTPDLLAGKRSARPSFVTSLDDGSTFSSGGASYCVARECGTIIPRATGG